LHCSTLFNSDIFIFIYQACSIAQIPSKLESIVWFHGYVDFLFIAIVNRSVRTVFDFIQEDCYVKAKTLIVKIFTFHLFCIIDFDYMHLCINFVAVFHLALEL
jgi:hypothetical protein